MYTLFFVCVALACCVVPKRLVAGVVKGTRGKTLAIHTVLSGLTYYLYNEVAFLALDSVQPVTHAVGTSCPTSSSCIPSDDSARKIIIPSWWTTCFIGNTIKRVVIIIASVFVFATPMTRKGQLGSAIAIAGTLLYSLAKQRWK